MLRITIFSLVVLFGGQAVGFAQTGEQELSAQFRDSVQPVLEQHCYRCHGPKKQKSAVRVDTLDGSLEDKQLFLLEHVLKQLKEGAMPPEEEPPLDGSERKTVIEWVEHALLEGERQVRARNGSVRRLTVAQYHNTLRDLLGVEDRLANALPADGVSKEGFLNNGDTLLMTPQMMETYFAIAEKALDICLIDDATKPRIQCFRVELGQGLNKEPSPDHIELEGPQLLPKTDFLVRQVRAKKSFSFDPLEMQTRFRFVEGYKGNATVRGWKDFDSIYHSVFAAIIGSYTGGYNYGRSYHMIPEGLLLRPRSPETKNGVPPVRGPAPTFSMPMRELPSSGILQVTVEAARYDDGLQIDTPAIGHASSIEIDQSSGTEAALEIPIDGVYQLDVVLSGAPRDDVIVADIGDRTFSKRLKGTFTPGPDREVVIPFFVGRFSQGTPSVKIKNGDNSNLLRARFTPVEDGSPVSKQFAVFEQRVPHVSVHMGVRTDVGPRLSRFSDPKPVPSAKFERYSFRAPVSSFASPEIEDNNVNYLAGLREIAIRSEPTDGRQIPRVLIGAVEIEGPYYENWPPKGHRDIFIASEHKDDPPAYAREIVERFATRAFRRPVKNDELESLVRVWANSDSKGKGFRESVKDALLVVLTSPQFLFLIEESAGPEAEPLSPHEIASKLSYFLWNTTPDEPLLSLANNGTLKDRLSSEVNRMIADERFNQFANPFVSQWLSLDKFDVVNINHGTFPRLNREVRRELRKEPIHFVQHLIKANLPLSNLIDSDFIVLNDVVAGYYGLGNRAEQGFAFAPVHHQREFLGGVLTQAAVLSGLSDGHESNPVKRGAWLARRIIDEPPDPPPPNVPDLPANKEAKTLRQRLEQHRNQEGCVKCHEKIDPWGLPLEEFDAAGLFKNEKVDASTTLPDKTDVTNTRELKRYLAEDRIDQVATSFLKHLTVYAIGRSLNFNEIEYLNREGRKVLKPRGYRMKDCVQFVIESPMFMEK